MARNRSVDRRNFLKGAAVTGAAALVPDQSHRPLKRLRQRRRLSGPQPP